MSIEKYFGKVAAVVEAQCSHADIIIVFQTEQMLKGEYEGMRAVATAWLTKKQAGIVASSLGCSKLTDMIGKPVQLKLKETEHVFADVLGIYPTTMDLVHLVKQPLPRWISRWKTGRIASPFMKEQV